MSRARRIAKELADIQADPSSRVIANPVNEDDLTHLKGQFSGPPETPYEGGLYKVDIKIPMDYPFRPPQMRFDTKIWHPNISSQTGAICLDTLGVNWSPVLTIKSTLLSLQSLLTTPEPKDPQDAEVASMLLHRPDEFERVARDWAERYAGAPKRSKGGSSGGLATERAAEHNGKSREQEERERLAAYDGYNKDLINRFCDAGFDVERVVEAFQFFGIDRNGGEDYELEEAYIGDITARLFGEA